MSEGSESPYLDPYRDAVREMGAGFESQLWLSREAQKRRFRVIERFARPEGRILADIGSGVADLLMYLKERDRLPERYIGIEGVAEMTEHAIARAREHGIGGASCSIHDFVRETDLARQLVGEARVEVFVFSGSLNTLQTEDAIGVLDRYYDALEGAGRGRLVFNFLSDRVDKQRTPAHPPAVRFDTVRMLDWAFGRSPLVRMSHDHLRGHDCTILMRVPEGA